MTRLMERYPPPAQLILLLPPSRQINTSQHWLKVTHNMYYCTSGIHTLSNQCLPQHHQIHPPSLFVFMHRDTLAKTAAFIGNRCVAVQATLREQIRDHCSIQGQGRNSPTRASYVVKNRLIDRRQQGYKLRNPAYILCNQTISNASVRKTSQLAPIWLKFPTSQ